MKLNRTGNALNRKTRNDDNENWGKIEELSKEVDDLVLESGGDSNLEVIQARGGYSVLNNRLNDFDDQLTTKASKVFVEDGLNDLDERKADIGALTLISQTKRDKDVEIGMHDLDQEVREAFTGGAVPVVGEDSVGNINLRPDAVTRDKMANNYAINYPYLSDDTFDLDYIWDEGNYILTDEVINNFVEGGSVLKVERFKTEESSNLLWVRQTIMPYSPSSVDQGSVHSRVLSVNENSLEIRSKSDWKRLDNLDIITSDMLDEDYRDKGYLSDETYDLDQVIGEGNYYVNADVKNNPYGRGGSLTVFRYKVTGAENFTRIVQFFVCHAGGKYQGRYAIRSFRYNDDTGELAFVSDWSDGSEEPIKILTIGNSFGLDATKYIHRICESAGVNVMSGSLYISGGYFEDHYNNINNNTKVYEFYRRYHVDGTITDDYQTDYSVDDALELEDWDYVFFNQASAQSGVYSSFQPYLTNIIEYVKGKQPNIKVALIPTWAYASDFDDTRFDKYNRDQMTMYVDIINAYKDAMADVDFDVIIPAGTAIQNARTDDYLNSLDRELTRDGYHLSNTGCYIAGLTLFQTLINKDNKRLNLDYIPDGISKKTAYLGMIAVENSVINPLRVVEIN